MAQLSSAGYLLQHQGHEIEVRYKDVQHLRLRVLRPDARLKISAPWHVTAAEVRAFVDANLDWIDRASRRVLESAPVPEPLVDGGRVRLWGAWQPLRVRTAARASARFEDGEVRLSGEGEGLEAALHVLHRQQLAEALPGLVEAWQPRVGRSFSRVRLRRMSTRWGSCNTRTAAATFNTALAQFAPSCLEYVVVHELTHLLERGHGPAFTGHLDRLLPGWRSVQDQLRRRP